MIFANVKALSIPEGVVTKITSAGKVLWQLVKAKYTNQIPISTDANGNIYNGKGWKENTWVNGGNENFNWGTYVTGYIPCKIGDIVRLKNVKFDNTSTLRLSFFDSNKNYIGQIVGNGTWNLDTMLKGEKDSSGNYIKWTITDIANISTNCAYIRITALMIDSTSIVTINQPIADYTNQVPISTDTDGSIYNGVGYKDNTRLSSSGGVSSSAQANSVTTGFIPFPTGDKTVIRIKGVEWLNANANYSGHYYVQFYKADKTICGSSMYLYSGDTDVISHIVTITRDANGVETFSFNQEYGTTNTMLQAVRNNAKYIRINAYGKGADFIVTINEEIE